MTGISEILVLILLISGVLILPRMVKPPKGSARKKATHTNLTTKMRAGILISVMLPVGTAIILKPWTGNILPFIIIGILPVALAWGVFWVLSARKN